MPTRIRKIVMLVAAFAVVLSLLPRLASSRSFGNHQGYTPAQPIDYSHRLHAGELQIQCLYCHHGAEKSRHAGIPSANVCMNCHKYVSETWGAIRAEEKAAKAEGREARWIVSPEIKKLYDALGLDEKAKPIPGATRKPIRWMQVHRLPDFVYFNHRAHVNAGVDCQTCHGTVEAMERMRQEGDLSMGWCVNCHRDAHADGINGNPVTPSTDCSGCHY